MESLPSNREVAVFLGISESDVARYRGDTILLGDGSWLIHFSFTMPKELRQRFTGSFTLVLKAPAPPGDARQPAPG